jgi:ribonuclease R
MGQRLGVDDREGARWSVDCLGEPLEVGARIIFEPIGSADARRGAMTRLQDGSRREWICTLHRGRGQQLELAAFGGLSSPELILHERDAKKARDGDRVVVVGVAKSKDKRNVSSRTRREAGTRSVSKLPVRVVEVLGPAGEPDSDHRAVVWKHRLAREFPRRARIEAEALPEEIESIDIEGRLDLRHLPFITIDPASARDHDDAVFAEERPKETLGLVDMSGEKRGSRPTVAWKRRLWVAIADVAHFVTPGGAIDAEARRRGNSFYFPDRAIPMLPERLSTQMCSLRPDVDRLAMVVELRIVDEGRVADAIFHEAVIRSHARLSYEEAASRLDSSDEDDGESPVWSASLHCLDRIAEDLSAARRSAGAITLELPEIGIELDATGRPVDAVLRERNRAHILIEEAMLAANRAVASALDRAGRVTLHRVHPPPSPQKLAGLAMLLDRLALRDDADLEEPGAIARILENVRGTPSEEQVHMAALRSMSQARYESESGGHYALRFDHYLHFTSPIRRYADLDVHRTLKSLIRGEAATSVPGKRAENCERLAIWLSGRERVAVEVERDAEALACCAILKGREGESFRAEVSAATEFGLFIRLESPAASGLVPLRTLKGHWSHDVEEETLIAPRGGMRIGRGDSVDVRLIEVDADRGRLAFALVQTDSDPGQSGPRGRGRQSAKDSSSAESSSESRSHSR